jgi:hypothetical protein
MRIKKWMRLYKLFQTITYRFLDGVDTRPRVRRGVNEACMALGWLITDEGGNGVEFIILSDLSVPL